MKLLVVLCLLASAVSASALNVVFILADDLGIGELGCYGQRKIHTPNIDRLAREGTRFTKVKAGHVNDTPGFFPDWFPTLCAAAGITTPAGLDGTNLWPNITADTAIERKTPMLWVFPEFSILDGAYANLDTLFSISPMVFMFLIPAVTMRTFAEEK